MTRSRIARRVGCAKAVIARSILVGLASWNYVAVHAYGRLTLIQDPEALTRLVEDFVQVYEQSMPDPWQLNGREEFVRQKIEQIIGFRIEIEHLEGKWKLSQNPSSGAAGEGDPGAKRTGR
jgi:predicted FMN-binding regulatory protein PaiB